MTAASKPATKTLEYRFPDFIGIGAQKAGTTWLDNNLRRHPQLWLPPIKELQYFNDVHVPSNRKWTVEHRRRRGKQVLARYLETTPRENWNYPFIARVADIVEGAVSDDWYGRIFTLADPEQLCGEITPDYCTLPEKGIRHVLRLSPNVKIILSLRDPIARSWSHIRMLAKARAEVGLPQMEQFARRADIVKRADYAAMISNWKKLVPDARILVILMDDIATQPVVVLDKVCVFLGILADRLRLEKSGRPIHVGEKEEIPSSIYAILRDKLKPTYDTLGAMYPEIGRTWSALHF